MSEDICSTCGKPLDYIAGVELCQCDDKDRDIAYLKSIIESQKARIIELERQLRDE